MAIPSRRSPIISVICVVLAILCAIAAIFYWTQRTNLLAGGNPALHHKHAVVFGVLTVLFLLAAILFRPRRARLA